MIRVKPRTTPGFRTRMRLDRTVAEVAALVGGRVEGPADRRLAKLLSLQEAGPDDLAPVFGAQGAVATATLAASRAGALLAGASATLPARGAGAAPCAIIRVENADLALDALVLALTPAEDVQAPGVHPTAILGPDVSLGHEASIGPHVVLGRGVSIGARTRLLPGVCIGEHAVIGADVTLHPHVVIGSRCVLGDRVTVFAGSVIGKDGFGFRQDKQGRHHRIPQRGIVVVGDDVEIGAHCTIDRARFTETRIGKGSKLDNQVHLAHNVELGEHCAFAAQVGVAGSTIFGKHVFVGGHSGFGNGLRLGDRVAVSGFTGVNADVEAGTHVSGFPATPHRAWARDLFHVRRLGELFTRVKALEAAAAAGDQPPTGADRPDAAGAPERSARPGHGA